MAENTQASPAAPKAEPSWKTFKLKRNVALREEYTPYPFQDFSVYKALSQNVFLFGLPTGTGKSMCSLQTFMYYIQRYPNCKLIIVTDSSATIQFAKEITKFYHHKFRITAVHSRMPAYSRGQKYADRRAEAIRRWSMPVGADGGIDILTMNWAIFRGNRKDLEASMKDLKKADQRIVCIYDEATAIQNLTAETGKWAKYVSKKYADKVVGLTATLSKGKLESIYGIFSNMGLSITPTKAEFEDRYCVIVQHPRDRRIRNIVGYKNLKELVQIISPFCIHLRKSDVAEFLPAFVLSKRMIEHSPQQARLINDIYNGRIKVADDEEGVLDEESFESENSEEAPVNANPFTALKTAKPVVQTMDSNPFTTFLQQNSNFSLTDDVPGEPAPAVEEESQTHKKVERLTSHGFIKRTLMDPAIVAPTEENINKHSPKTEYILNMLINEFVDEKVVIYTPSRKYMLRLAEAIRNDKKVPEKYKSVFEIRGGVSIADRDKFKELFSTDPNHNVIILNDAGIQAINLQVSDTLIVTSLPKSGGDMVQLAGRISRIGSANSSLNCIHLMHENSQDEDDYAVINQQMQLVSTISGGEPEKGLIDWELLKGLELKNSGLHVDKEDLEFTEEEVEEYASSVSDNMILHNRKTRKAYYAKLAKSFK